MDGDGAVLAKVAVGLEVGAGGEHDVLDSRAGAAGLDGRPAAAVGQVGPVQAFALGACDPALDRAEADAEASGHGTHRPAAADGPDDRDAAGMSSSNTTVIFFSWTGRRRVFQHCTDLQLVALH